MWSIACNQCQFVNTTKCDTKRIEVGLRTAVKRIWTLINGLSLEQWDVKDGTHVLENYPPLSFSLFLSLSLSLIISVSPSFSSLVFSSLSLFLPPLSFYPSLSLFLSSISLMHNCMCQTSPVQDTLMTGIHKSCMLDFSPLYFWRQAKCSQAKR